MFIGACEIEKEMLFEGDETLVEITAVDHEPIRLCRAVYDVIKSEEKGNGDITDMVTRYFASKFFKDLADSNLDYYMVANVCASLQTLVHNARERLLSDTFDCSGGDAIKLSLVLEAGTAVKA